MKKKVIAFMLAMCMTFTVTACGGVAVNNKEIAVITFDGEAYDLSEDFQNVVVKMTENGVKPIEMMRVVTYDEDGKWKKWDWSSEAENVCYVMEMDILHRGNAMECPIIVDQYESYVDFGCTFERQMVLRRIPMRRT